jgi:poly(beta-D-mannuronate) lyase
MILSFRLLNAIGLVGSLLLCGLVQVQVMGTAAAAVDTTRPYLAISSPSNGATITAASGKITVKGSATDAGSGIANVWIRLDREKFTAVTPKAPNDWSSWTASLAVSGGYHNITAKARDNSGNERWRTVTVEVQRAEDDIPRAIRTVTADSIGTLMAAISSARPGDHIVLRNGIYDNTSWLTSRGLKNMLVRGIDGTAEAPIVISAETIGGVEIRGPGGFRFDEVAHLIVRGFKFTHSQDNAGSSDDTAIQCDLCSNVRFTRNLFELNTSSRISAEWLSISSGQSDHNRIDHNSFKNKTTRGVFLLIFGKHTVVDHNYFYNHNYSGGNGGECIRIGNSENGLVDYYSRIEYNLFEKCNGDMEAISVKSSSNTFKANTFRYNEGSLTFRHGNNNIADGNFFLSGENGIRSYGHDHLIVNNYFGSLTGTGSLTPLVIGSGTVEEDLSRSNSEHSRSRNVVVAFNTFYNNQDTYLRIGEDFRSLAPVDITVAHNILAGNSGTLVAHDEGQEIAWSKNILYGSASKGNMPSSGYVSVNPQLTARAGGIYGISSNSPAIDKASSSSYSPVVTDMDGQPRSGMKDTGADEYSGAGIKSRPLSASGVGPAS